MELATRNDATPDIADLGNYIDATFVELQLDACGGIAIKNHETGLVGR
jgi:hypothetical protein